MANLEARIRGLSKAPGGAWRDRVFSELRFAHRMVHVTGEGVKALEKALTLAEQAVQADGALTAAKAQEVEQALAPLAKAAKEYRVLCVGHAHIDMNWMWSYDETVSITLDTFRTVLDLMRDFPKFTYAQSQASVYRIVEEFAPEMLPEIKKRVKEGRWEVSASTWVEADRNMPSAESVARHHLYTREYLSKLLDIDGDTLNFDFEPDTFGHSRNTPEQLAAAGVKYYYHCRGYDGHKLYRWRAPSGAEILVLREPFWYLGPINNDLADLAPEFAKETGMKTFMRVYGVGDHGGGPTRRDLQRLTDMAQWPVFPSIEFGTYAAFYAEAEKVRANLPIVDRELNPMFTGCYTTQTRIKRGNRFGERMLGEAEAVSAIARVAVGSPYRAKEFAKGWVNVLFNQFHDIIPGSGVIDTREHALGLYSETQAIARSERSRAVRAIADQIDTSALKPDCDCGEISQGAGVGFMIQRGATLAQVERGYGAVRIFHLFNPSAFPRKEVVELTVWDWNEDLDRLIFTDANGKTARHQVITSGHNGYWGHDFTKVLIEAELPALGYATYAMRVSPDAATASIFPMDARVEYVVDLAIENELLSLSMSHDPCRCATLTNKATGQSLCIEGFIKTIEDTSLGMSAWTRGELREAHCVTSRVVKRSITGALLNQIKVEAATDNSTINYTLSLYAGGEHLEADIDVDWREMGYPESGHPALSFRVNAQGGQPVFDIPGGALERQPSIKDLPGIRYVAKRGDKGAAMLLSDSKYGYVAREEWLEVTLVRSSFAPDPLPEIATQHIRLGVALPEATDALAMSRIAQRFENTVTVLSGQPRKGKLPLSAAYLEVVKGTIEIQAVKLSQDGKAMIVRGVELNGAGKGVQIKTALPFTAVSFADTHERPVAGKVALKDGKLSFDARPYGAFTLRLEI